MPTPSATSRRTNSDIGSSSCSPWPSRAGRREPSHGAAVDRRWAMNAPVSLEPWRWQHRDETAPVWPGLPPAARRDLVADGHQLRGLVARGDRDVGVPVRRRRRRDPAPADRAHPRRLARRDPRRAGRPALRLPRRRPVGPDARPRFNPDKLLLDPYARAISGEVVARPDPLAVRRRPSPRSAATVDSAPCDAALASWSHDDFDWGDDRPLRTRWRDTVIYELHVKGFTQLHTRSPSSLRGTYAGLGSPTVTDYLRDLGVTAVELLPGPPLRHRARRRRPRADQLLGLQLDRLLRPARGVLLRRATAASRSPSSSRW